jgi:hypothetical protein
MGMIDLFVNSNFIYYFSQFFNKDLPKICPVHKEQWPEQFLALMHYLHTCVVHLTAAMKNENT